MKTLSLVILCVLAAAGFAQTDVPTEPSTSEAPAPTPTPVPDVGNKTTTTTPGTTTSLAPSTTTAIPAPTAGQWSVSTGGNICLMVKLGAKFSFNYTDSAGKDNQTFAVNLPSNETTSSGSCGPNPDNATAQNIQLTFGDSGKCSMTLHFIKTKSKFSVNEIDLSFDVSCFPEKMSPKQTVTGKVTGSYFQATVGQSYMCNSDQSLKANSTINSLMVDFVDVQVQAFAKEAKFDFGAAQECPQDAETSNIVPIAVGAALAALVLIVLIAYLISRNRGQRGYESV